MTAVDIKRNPSTDSGTFGQFYIDGKATCFTCELPWKDNAPNVSCIPPGTYHCVRHISKRFPKGNTWEITGVPNRTGVLIHNANDIEDLEGCVAVGNALGSLNGRPAVMNSVKTLTMLNLRLPDSFTLTITG